MERSLHRDYATLEHDHWWFRARRRILHHVLASELGAGSGRRLLDVGIGAGVFTRELARYGAVVAVEPDRDATVAARRLGLDVRQATATQLPLEDASVDVACALDVLEHVPDDAQALHELRRVLRPGGLAVITVPAIPRLWSEHDRAAHHVRRYRRRALMRRVTEAGLEIEWFAGLNVVLAPVIVTVRVVQGLRRRVTVCDAGPSAGRADRAGPRSDFALPSRPVNRVLTEAFAAERHLYRRWPLPIGISLLVVARAPSP